MTAREGLEDPREPFTEVLNCGLTSDQGTTCWDQSESLFLGWVYLHQLRAPRRIIPKGLLFFVK